MFLKECFKFLIFNLLKVVTGRQYCLRSFTFRRRKFVYFIKVNILNKG